MIRIEIHCILFQQNSSRRNFYSILIKKKKTFLFPNTSILFCSVLIIRTASPSVLSFQPVPAHAWNTTRTCCGNTLDPGVRRSLERHDSNCLCAKSICRLVDCKSVPSPRLRSKSTPDSCTELQTKAEGSVWEWTQSSKIWVSLLKVGFRALAFRETAIFTFLFNSVWWHGTGQCS